MEVARLAQGCGPGMPAGTNTIFFIEHKLKPKHKKATYLRIVTSETPHKEEMKRVRWTVGGDRIQYDGDLATPTANLTTVKCHINSVISTPGAQYGTIDIKNFYLGTPMQVYEYMRVPLSVIPQAIIDHYNLEAIAQDGQVMVEIQRGMYGLPQSGILANTQLQQHLSKSGYTQVKHTHGLFRHKTRNISFTLVVDDFGVKYSNRADLDHLNQALQTKYTTTSDFTGTLYCGLTLKWNYQLRYVDISMPGYIEKALQRFKLPSPYKQQHSPHAHINPKYGARVQFTAPPDTSPRLSPKETTTIQEVIGTLLYYARAVDLTLHVALGTLGSVQTKPTTNTALDIDRLLRYVASHPDATIRYHASDMVLYIHSDASYLSETEARSRAGGYFFLANKTSPPAAPTPPINGAIHVYSTIIKNVLSSAAEAELAALFLNAKEAVAIRTTLSELGHPQPSTPIQTDNKCAAGIANDTVKQKRSKAIDMRFYWIRDRVKQDQFLVHWQPGSENLGDYFTKHFGPAHHQKVRPTYLVTEINKRASFQRTISEGLLIHPPHNSALCGISTHDLKSQMQQQSPV